MNPWAPDPGHCKHLLCTQAARSRAPISKSAFSTGLPKQFVQPDCVELCTKGAYWNTDGNPVTHCLIDTARKPLDAVANDCKKCA